MHDLELSDHLELGAVLGVKLVLLWGEVDGELHVAALPESFEFHAQEQLLDSLVEFRIINVDATYLLAVDELGRSDAGVAA